MCLKVNFLIFNFNHLKKNFNLVLLEDLNSLLISWIWEVITCLVLILPYKLKNLLEETKVSPLPWLLFAKMKYVFINDIFYVITDKLLPLFCQTLFMSLIPALASTSLRNDWMITKSHKPLNLSLNIFYRIYANLKLNDNLFSSYFSFL